MTGTRNRPEPKRKALARRNIDFVGGPRTPDDPRSYRQGLGSQASQLAGLGLRYDPDGKLEIDPQNVSLLEQTEANEASDVWEAAVNLADAGRMARVLEANAEGVTVISNSVVETDYYSYTIKPDVLVGNRTIRLLAWGRMLQNASALDDATVRVYLGGTTLFSDTYNTQIAQDANRRLFYVDLQLSANDSDASQDMVGHIVLHAGETATTGNGRLDASPLFDAWIGSLASTVDMTLEQAFRITVQLATASASYTLTRQHALVYIY